MLFAFGTGTPATVIAVPLLVAGIDLAAVLAGGDGIGRADSGVLSPTLPGDVPALGLLDAVFLGAFAAWALDYDLRPRVAIVAMTAGVAVALVLLSKVRPTVPPWGEISPRPLPALRRTRARRGRRPSHRAR